MSAPKQHAHLARHIDERKVRDAVHAAEAGTSAKIQVVLGDRFQGSTLDHAANLFKLVGLDRSPQRNGVLFFVAPHRREFAVVGDAGVHERVGQEFWDRVAAAMSERIGQDDLTAGLVHGIEAAGTQLRQHFPR
jgi:uncharacterized membrane protein